MPTMASPLPDRAKFDTARAAMQQIYQFPAAEASSWTPPPMSDSHRGRYLWTDAFAVVNFITMFRQTSNYNYLELAKQLIQTVHDILGCTRDGSTRLPNATDKWPLQGGLRIGKNNATGPDADGQYHHYLTIWMFALNRMSIALGEKSYNDQAISLAKAIHPRFVYDRGSPRPRMYWKMSIDLSIPLVRSEGHLDPFSGFVVFRLMQDTDGEGSQVLAEEIADYKKILETKWRTYTTDDPLDIGMTLWAAHWFNNQEEWATELSKAVIRDAESLFENSRYFDQPLRSRLAFREYGTCLGIQSITNEAIWQERVERLLSIWEQSGIAKGTADPVLGPINLVMMATALCPTAFLQ